MAAATWLMKQCCAGVLTVPAAPLAGAAAAGAAAGRTAAAEQVVPDTEPQPLVSTSQTQAQTSPGQLQPAEQPSSSEAPAEDQCFPYTGAELATHRAASLPPELQPQGSTATQATTPAPAGHSQRASPAGKPAEQQAGRTAALAHNASEPRLAAADDAETAAHQVGPARHLVAEHACC